ncbi:flagellar biosynthetic protein FliR [Cronobacter muytjensii]
MLQFTSDQWLHWLTLYFWPLLRVLALISTAPILSERAISIRVKIGLALLITIALAPNIPGSNVPIFSLEGLWLGLQQILIGIAVGFTMQFAFAAVRTAGELIGLQMGLSFATFFDPGSRLNMPVLARFIDMLALNLALGLLNRMAPQLTVFAIGFPLTLSIGIIVMAALMPLIAPFCEHLFAEIFHLLTDIVSEIPAKG